MNGLNQLYSKAFKSWGGVIKPDWSMWISLDNQEYPVKVDDMQTYLPVTAMLEGNTVDKVFFHPACENILSKETEIFKVIRKVSGLHLMATFKKFFNVLCEVSRKKGKKNLRSDVIDMLEPFKNLNSNDRQEVVNLLAKLTVLIEENKADNRFIHFTIMKGGRNKQTGERIYYKTKPIFPLYSELVRKLSRSESLPDNQQLDINGFSVSKRAVKATIHLFETVLPGVTNPSDYEVEYCRSEAARFCSYLLSYALVAEDMNKIQNQFRAEFDKEGVYSLDIDWLTDLEDIGELYRLVPALNYNSHNTQSEESIQASNQQMMGIANTNTVQTVAQPFQNTQVQQVQQQQQQTQQGAVQLNAEGKKVVYFNNMEFVVEPPDTLRPDEVYQGYQIDPRGSVLHSALTHSGGRVMYRCSKMGNVMAREEVGGVPGMMQGGVMGGMMMPGMMMPQMMGMIPGMMQVQQPSLVSVVQPTVQSSPVTTYGVVASNSASGFTTF